MTTPIAVFTGDNHLRPTTWAKHPDLYGDSYAALRQIVDYCIEQHLPLILLGDLFDKSRPDSLSVGMYIHAVERMREAGLAVYYVEGNHDKADPPWASLHVHAQHAGAFEIAGVRFYGIDFTPAGELPARLTEVPADCQVLLMHQSWLEIQRVGHTDGTFSQIPRAVTLLTGDYHMTDRYGGTAADGGTVTAYSPGSTSMQALNEPHEKFFGVLNADLSVRFQPLVTRPYMFSTLTTEPELQTWLESLEELRAELRLPTIPEIRKPIMRVRYQDAIPEAYDRLTAAVGDEFHLFLEPQRTTITEVIDETATPEGAFDSLITAVGELSEPGSAVYNGVRRLLEAEDPKTELERMFEEYQQRHAQAQPEGNTTGVPPGHVG